MSATFLERLAPVSARALLKDRPSVELDAGRWLYREGDAPAVVHVVRRGLVKLVKGAPDGAQTLLTMTGPGELLGVHAVLEGVNRSAGAQVIQDATVVIVSREQLLGTVRAHADVATTLLADLSRQLRLASGHIVDLAGRDHTTLLASRLVELATHDGFADVRHCDGTTVILDLPLSQQEIADWAGVSSRSLATALSRMRSAGLVSTSRMQLVIHDLPALTRLVGKPETIESH